MRYSAYNMKEQVYHYIKNKPGVEFSEITAAFCDIGIIDLDDLIAVLINEKRITKKWHHQGLGLFAL